MHGAGIHVAGTRGARTLTQSDECTEPQGQRDVAAIHIRFRATRRGTRFAAVVQ